MEMVVFLIEILKVVYTDLFKAKLDSELDARSRGRLSSRADTIIFRSITDPCSSQRLCAAAERPTPVVFITSQDAE